jgi:hypothetical protein
MSHDRRRAATLDSLSNQNEQAKEQQSTTNYSHRESSQNRDSKCFCFAPIAHRWLVRRLSFLWNDERVVRFVLLRLALDSDFSVRLDQAG